MEITAAVVEAHGQAIQLQTLEIDEPGPGEVLVRLVATGVCHTDGLARHGDLPFPLPGVLGHEGAGVVGAVGPGSQSFAPATVSSSAGRRADSAATARPVSRATAPRLGELLVGGSRRGGELRVAPGRREHRSTATSSASHRSPPTR